MKRKNYLVYIGFGLILISCFLFGNETERNNYWLNVSRHWQSLNPEIQLTNSKLIDHLRSTMKHQDNHRYSNLIHHIYRLHGNDIIEEHENKIYFWKNHNTNTINNLHQELIAKAKSSGLKEKNGHFWLNDSVSFEKNDFISMRELSARLRWTNLVQKYQQHYIDVVKEKYQAISQKHSKDPTNNNISFSFGVAAPTTANPTIWVNDFLHNYIPVYVVPYVYASYIDSATRTRLRELMDEWEDAVNLNPNRTSNMLVFYNVTDTTHHYLDHRVFEFRLNENLNVGGSVTHIGLPEINNYSSEYQNIRYAWLVTKYPHQYHDNPPYYSGTGLESPRPTINVLKRKQGSQNAEYVIEYQQYHNIGVIIRSDNSIQNGSGQVNQKEVFYNLTEYLSQLNKIKRLAIFNLVNTETNFTDTKREKIVIDSAYNAINLHELGHILGLLHEQARPDRDNWVRGTIEGTSPGRYLTDYDVKSIMQYPNTHDRPQKLNCNNTNNQCYDSIIYQLGNYQVQDTENKIFPNHFISEKDKQGIKVLYPERVRIWRWQNGGW